MFGGLNEMAITNAYNMYRCHHTIEESSAHGFRNEFMCDLTRRMVEVAEESGRSRSAVNPANNGFVGGHTLERTEEWIGEGKNKRRKRLDCSYCPWEDELGQRVHRAVTTFCPACNVPLHDKCFAAYHAQQGFQLINSFGATPASRSKGGRPRNLVN